MSAKDLRIEDLVPNEAMFGGRILGMSFGHETLISSVGYFTVWTLWRWKNL